MFLVRVLSTRTAMAISCGETSPRRKLGSAASSPSSSGERGRLVTSASAKRRLRLFLDVFPILPFGAALSLGGGPSPRRRRVKLCAVALVAELSIFVAFGLVWAAADGGAALVSFCFAMRGRLVSPFGDLTDSYLDESVTSLSPLKTRHPRGDSPLSSRPPSSLSTVSSLSRPPTTLPSLDRLISFLDDELDDDPPPPPRLAASKARAAPPKTSTPPRTLPPMSPPPLHTHSKSMRISPAPELTFMQRREDATMGSSSTGETPEEDDTLSPSQRTERSRRERTMSFPEGDRAGSGTGHHATVGRAMGKEIESRMEGRGDESPSPRPGTMAELREKSLRESLVSGNGAGRPVEEREATERRVPSGDSVARLADEVILEHLTTLNYSY